MTHEIIRYTRNRKGERNGCLVASVVDGKVRIGYSKCHKADEFDKSLARSIAESRMLNDKKDYTTTLPSSMLEEFKRFNVRCGKYFKNLA